MGDSRVFAVITGDLIESGKLADEELRKARRTLLKSVKALQSWDKRLVRSKAEFFRGDSWQVLLAKPELALRAALFLRARLKSTQLTDTRIAIGIGTVDVVSPKRVSLSSGEAFRLSGHALDELSGSSRFAVSFPDGAPRDMVRWLPVVAAFCDSIAQQWQPRQSEMVSLAILPKNLRYEDIAKRVSKPAITKQAVSKSLEGASWSAIRLAVEEFEKCRWGELIFRST
jgi:hypothetical protein